MEAFAAGRVELGHATVKLATAGRICIVTDQAAGTAFAMAISPAFKQS